jgi:hypothetical protein
MQRNCLASNDLLNVDQSRLSGLGVHVLYFYSDGCLTSSRNACHAFGTDNFELKLACLVGLPQGVHCTKHVRVYVSARKGY